MNNLAPESINAVAARWTEIVWAVSWQFCVLGLVVLVVHWSLRSAAPNWRYWLWQILAVKLLLMPFWTATAPWKIPSKSPATEFIAKSPDDDAARVTVSTNPVNSTEVLPQQSLLGASKVIRPRPPIAKRESHPLKATGSLTKNSPAERTRQVRPLISDPSPQLAMNRDAHPSAPSDSAAPVLAPRLEAVTAPGWSWQAWLMFAWAGGVAWLGCRIIWQGISLGRRLRETKPGDAELVLRVRAAAARLGMSRIPDVGVIKLDVSPFVCGLWRTRLIVPQGLTESFTAEQLDLVLLHELAHVRRRDLVWGWIPEVGRVLFFFHPVVQFVCTQIRFERELACDQLALQSSGNDVATYADTLVRVVGQFSAPDSFRLLTGSRVELSTFWKRRMNMLPKIASLKSSSSRRGRWSLILCSLALFALPTWFARAQSQEEKPKPVDAAASQKLPSNVKSATQDGTTETTTVRVQQPRSPGTTTATTAATQPDRMQVEFFPEPSTKEQSILRLLDMPSTFDFTDESLAGVRDAIMERHGFDILIDKVKLEEESIAIDATDITLKVAEIPLRSALRLLLRQKNLACLIEDDVLKITTETDYSNDRLTRTYPVRDLAGDEPDGFQSLMEAIKQGVTPGAWKDAPHLGRVPDYGAPAAAAPAGGGAAPQPKAATCTISMVPASGCLVIHQSWRGHDEVLKLLRAIRKAKNLSTGK